MKLTVFLNLLNVNSFKNHGAATATAATAAATAAAEAAEAAAALTFILVFLQSKEYYVEF